MQQCICNPIVLVCARIHKTGHKPICSGVWERLWWWVGREQIRILLDQHLHSGLSFMKDIWVLLRRTGRKGGNDDCIFHKEKKAAEVLALFQEECGWRAWWRTNERESQVYLQWPRIGSSSMHNNATSHACISCNIFVINIAAVVELLLGFLLWCRCVKELNM